jgi:spermidine synthase
LAGLDADVLGDAVLHYVDSGIQEIMLFREPDGSLSLTLDEMWQFNELDEPRYHEALVGVPMVFAQNVGRVLILGGGDALAVRDALKFDGVEKVVLCELDPEMIRMSVEHPAMREVNRDALTDSRVTVAIEDARDYLDDCGETFDAIMVDFPDPTNMELVELFKEPMYKAVARRLAPGGAVSVQSSSPAIPADFVKIRKELGKTFRYVAPYVVPMPKMGVSGMHLASQSPLVQKRAVPDSYRWLRQKQMEQIIAEGAKEMKWVNQRMARSAASRIR